MIEQLITFYKSKIRCLFFEHQGKLIFDKDNRQYVVECKHCGNKGSGYLDDN